MTVRNIVFALLSSASGIVATVNDRIYDAGALGTPTGKDIPAKPFIVLNYGPDQMGPDVDTARSFDRPLDVWFYAEKGDFTAVERALRQIRLALHGKTGWFEDPDNLERTWLASCRYQGGSGDLYDDIYRANAKYSTYRLIGNTP